MKTFIIPSKKVFTLFLISLSLLLFSCKGGQNLEIKGIDGPKLYLDQDYMRIDTIFENVEIVGGGRISFALLGLEEYKNSFIEVSPAVPSGTLIAVSISLHDILYGQDGIDQLEPKSLPDGRPLPGIAGGRLPSLAFSVEQFNNMGFYIGKRVFGIWYPLAELNGIGVNNIITARFYSDGKRAGNLSLVGPNAEGTHAGFLLMIDLGDKSKKYLKKYYKRWKRKNR
ncbi:MAG: hypothetical protein KAQ98_02730 [Bacteriovoracaceae bacterium]|nr:hypothetical protein [Bacteriovoracaceae bacterium]